MPKPRRVAHPSRPPKPRPRAPSRRAATLVAARRCDALQLEGEYADPNHVDGWRKIKVTGDRARITGQDDPGGPSGRSTD